MRRSATTASLAALAALAFVPLADAGTQRASVAISPAVFSPHGARVEIDAALPRSAPLGLQVLSPQGAAVGWLARERARSTLRLSWRGVLGGRRLADGDYVLRLVSHGKPLAQTRFRVDATAPVVRWLRVESGPRRFAGDRNLLATVSPNGDGLRDSVRIRFRLSEAATVVVEADRTVRGVTPVWKRELSLPAGLASVEWRPSADTSPRTYLVRVTATDAAGNRRLLGRQKIGDTVPRGPVVRVQGLDASFPRPSLAPGEKTRLRVATDAAAFDLQLFRGAGFTDKTSDSELVGTPVGPRVRISWRANRDTPGEVRMGIPQLPSGVYYAKLTADDGRIGYAPFVVRPWALGEHRVAVVMPTHTWQAYNLQDENGDGWGDTWYAGGPAPRVQLDRAYLRRGVPPFFRRYDAPFLEWLARHGITVDVLSDDELENATADELARAYDLIVFPGHHEYVTDAEMAAVTGFRDRGGNLAFLSANNFFWRVELDEDGAIRRTRQWRDLGKPEAGLIGVQYRANDDGKRQAPFQIRDTSTLPWLWEGTGLATGSLLGTEIGGYGTEIDGTSPASPPGTIVLAEIPDLLGPGKTAQMTWYQSPAGAKVFAAGALDFGGSVLHQPQDRLLQNLWAELTKP